MAAKWIGIAGQSNALYFVANDLPTGADVSRVARPSVDLGSNTGPYPLGWGPSDPYGYQVRLAGEVTCDWSRVTKPSVLWVQGEQDATGKSTTYAADLVALVARVDALMGRSDCVWGVVRLNIAFAGDSADAAIGTPLVRAGEASAVTTLGASRAFLIDVDDLTPNAQQHYSSAQYLTIWGRFLSGMVTATGDATWGT